MKDNRPKAKYDSDRGPRGIRALGKSMLNGKCGYVYLFLFIVGASLRSIPELIVKKYPVGYDTIAHYPFIILNFNDLGAVEWLRLAPLFYLVTHLILRASGMDVFMLLKLIGPLLYGSLISSFHFLLARGLGWRGKRALVGALVFASQLVTLRLSWDMFRLQLGLALMFITLGLANSETPGRRYLVAATSVLTVLAHQIATLILLPSMVWLIFREAGLSRKTLVRCLPLVPSTVLFLVILYITFLIPPPQDPMIIGLGPKAPFLSYFEADPRFMGGSYLSILRNVGMLLAFCYGLLLPFIVKGFENHEVLNPMLAILSLGSFSPLIIPFLSLPAVYWRWIILLIIPLSAYSANGMVKFNALWRRRGMGAILILLFFSILALGYASGTLPLRGAYLRLKGGEPPPLNPNHAGFDPIASVATYIPSSMVASSITVGNVTEGVDDAVASLNWLNKHARGNSCLLVEERFNGLARLYAQRDITLAIYTALYPVHMALQEAKAYNFDRIYLIWYSNMDINDFKEVYRCGVIAIYEHQEH